MNLSFASIGKARIVLFALLLLLLPAGLMAQGGAYTINHGPYLQGLTYDGVIVCFTTSHKGFSGVEIREKGSQDVRLCRTSKDGLFEADNTLNSISIEGLKPATEYEYRIISKQMLSFE
ncbi:MAG: fibronectin type III domain-containing protein, partial [Alistipes sp.]|nr:fibronectin type III domain-containing protein [Alistipes sp.]